MIGLTTYSALTTILLLVKRANQPSVRVTATPPPPPQRVHARILHSRTAPAIEQARHRLEGTPAPTRVRRARWV